MVLLVPVPPIPPMLTPTPTPTPSPPQTPRRQRQRQPLQPLKPRPKLRQPIHHPCPHSSLQSPHQTNRTRRTHPLPRPIHRICRQWTRCPPPAAAATATTTTTTTGTSDLRTGGDTRCRRCRRRRDGPLGLTTAMHRVRRQREGRPRPAGSGGARRLETTQWSRDLGCWIVDGARVGLSTGCSGGRRMSGLGGLVGRGGDIWSGPGRAGDGRGFGECHCCDSVPRVPGSGAKDARGRVMASRIEGKRVRGRKKTARSGDTILLYSGPALSGSECHCLHAARQGECRLSCAFLDESLCRTTHADTHRLRLSAWRFCIMLSSPTTWTSSLRQCIILYSI